MLQNESLLKFEVPAGKAPLGFSTFKPLSVNDESDSLTL
jgi:hypothetical protein